jgi:hypothetical protein
MTVRQSEGSPAVNNLIKENIMESDFYKLDANDMTPPEWEYTIASVVGAVNKRLVIAGIGLSAEYVAYSNGACIYQGDSMKRAIEAYNDQR